VTLPPRPRHGAGHGAASANSANELRTETTDGWIENELCTALTAGGYDVADVRSEPVLADGSRAAPHPQNPTVQELVVVVNTEIDEPTRTALVGFAIAWLQARRRRHPDAVEFVSVRGPSATTLIQIPIPV